jgi:hypothetical protein
VKANCFKLMRKNLGVGNVGGPQNGVGGTADVVVSKDTYDEHVSNFIGKVGEGWENRI